MVSKSFGRSYKNIAKVPDRPFNDRRYSVDSSKMRALGWEPEISFEDGFSDTIAWYLTNQWWWKSESTASRNWQTKPAENNNTDLELPFAGTVLSNLRNPG
ncbi:MAG: hypothetical protein LAT58_11580 [Opitutales bacterium]|nr:hypothetical protein [Opitutales bacterium]